MYSREEIVRYIVEERERQLHLYDEEFDSKNTMNDWTAFIHQYVADASKDSLPLYERRNKMIKAAAICLALLERDFSTEIAPRHYDE